MNCPGCGAPLRPDDEFECLKCEYCGSLQYPEPNQDGVLVLGEGGGDQCPVCAKALSLASIGDQRVLYCQDCGGSLIDIAVFAPLIGALRAGRGSFPMSPRPMDRRGFARHLKCPKCQAEMDTHAYGGPGNVVIDTCESCAVNWLDRGELGRIAASPDREYTSAR